jgi:alkylhydroperoxidase/carboxymuconolactone decarboxylase family protein YurZ
MKKKRSALALTATAAQSQTGAVKLHVKTCLRAGWTQREIGEILLHVYVYAGVYACLSGFHAAREAIAEYERERANGSTR